MGIYVGEFPKTLKMRQTSMVTLTPKSTPDIFTGYVNDYSYYMYASSNIIRFN